MQQQHLHGHKLSEHFSLYELLRSETAERQPKLLKAQMEPPEEVIANLEYLTAKTLEPIRQAFNYPIRVNSGYRSKALNQAVGGSKTSPHAGGEAVDIVISDGFLSDAATASLRSEISDRVKSITGKVLRSDINANFYLFAFICLELEKFDIDEVIHEYGTCFGHPAWIHIAVSQKANKRMIRTQGGYASSEYRHPVLAKALAFGC